MNESNDIPGTAKLTGESTFVLVDRVQAGDRDALTQLAERYYPRIHRMVRIRTWAKLRSSSELDDLVQDIFVRVLRGIETFERRSDALFVQWVSRVASNELSSQGRRRRERGTSGAEEDELRDQLARETRGVLTRIAGREEEELVDSCLAELPEEQREVLLLREYAGATWDEVAKEIDRQSVGACQQLYQRARRALGEKLALRGVERS